MMYDLAADAFRLRAVTVHSSRTMHQLAAIEGSSLRAPAGQHDDRADSFALCCAAIGAARKSVPLSRESIGLPNQGHGDSMFRAAPKGVFRA